MNHQMVLWGCQLCEVDRLKAIPAPTPHDTPEVTALFNKINGYKKLRLTYHLKAKINERMQECYEAAIAYKE